MVLTLTWLPEVLEAAGLKVAETPGWRTRGRGPMGDVRGVMCHHTATAAPGNMPTLNMLINGRADLSGPLAQLGLGRDGAFYVIAAGRANHAGAGRWEGIVTGNSSFIGIEAEHSGRLQDPWPEVQIDAYQRGVAALLKKLGRNANMCCGHKEYALPAGRKPDPMFDMAAFRNQVAALLAGKTPPPPIPAADDAARPTLRRGSTGAFVAQAQRAIGVADDGKFGPDTEAAMRAFQRAAGLVPDGIVGPKTWAQLTGAKPVAVAVPAAAVPVAAAPAMAAAPATLPPPDTDTQRPHVESGIAFGPDGTRFASRFKDGFFTKGRTTVSQWLAASGGSAGLSASLARVVAASCENEGGLEAINSYDNAHMSFGICQWTVGVGTAPGELAALLRRFKAFDAAAYQDCFGRYKLEPAAGPPRGAGFLLLSGEQLDTVVEKDVLRQVQWAYRFWRAGHHPSLRTCQIAHAADRTADFLDKTAASRPLREWLTSELGIALIFDEHVNRPGHVPKTLEQAIAGLAEDARDCTKWTNGEERDLIARYLRARNATNMTSSEERGRAIAAMVAKQKLSDARGSFVP
ncbi:N-acetylmuramoyl-L-alanine amidase [Sphingomonas sp. SUN019]|uniref:peptidoglycan recognition protein family protein n=1 Tax=Sphingomonas sp. SUN019 TaxID=2937788 RepID=UPI002164D467|nr:N-acetylmuramoyl-L-alanine amidase [Sphingomonas sp. SUN019]UVO51134.1 N-acetylmuramoyl-L-alanine amidase [Sphingomonas sp. SUN019]